MSSFFRFVLLTTLAFVGLIALAGARSANAERSAKPDAAPAIPACVQVATESRYVPFGYNHVVILRNGCARAVSCTVSTDVNPETQKVDVPAGTATEVMTFLGAAAASFTAVVTCR